MDTTSGQFLSNHRFAVLFLGFVLALLAATAPAQAAFPGANGKIAFSGDSNGDWAIFVMNADGSGETRLSSGGYPAWSADGRRIAFSANNEIYVMNADGSGETRLSSGSYPAWSPDGRRIAFVSNRGIGVMNADGTGQTRLTGPGYGPEWDQFPAWSPDGARIAFSRFAPVGSLHGPVEIYLMRADGSDQSALTDYPSAWDPAWSPDGQRIAFDRRNEIYVMNADGSGATQLTSMHGWTHDPAWSPDGTKIAFVNRSDTYELYVTNAAGCGQKRLSTTSDFIADPDWQPVPDDAAPSPPPPAKCSRTLSLFYSEKKARFRGRLGSQGATCFTEQKVSVFEQKKGRDPRIGSATTDEKGAYSLREKNAEGRFHAESKRTSIRHTSIPNGTCLAAKSKTVEVG